MNNLGNNHLINLEDDLLTNINFFIKYEGNNPTGSVKDRASHYVLHYILNNHIINKDTTIIESSSGNFGISLSSYCKILGLKCTIVIDPNILPINEYLISTYGSKIIKVTTPDETGGYLLTRTRLINKIITENENYYWVCQYSNPLVAEAYFESLGDEICDELNVDYMFLGVSSGGTITGVSRKIKKRYKNAKVIAVDVKGSVIFGDTPCKRYIPGIGSSMRPQILDHAMIDDIVSVSELETISACRGFNDRHFSLIGGSSGSVYFAVQKYFQGKTFDQKPNVVVLFADCGDRYANTIFDDGWVKAKYHIEQSQLGHMVKEMGTQNHVLSCV